MRPGCHQGGGGQPLSAPARDKIINIMPPMAYCTLILQVLQIVGLRLIEPVSWTTMIQRILGFYFVINGFSGPGYNVPEGRLRPVEAPIKNLPPKLINKGK